MGVTTHTSLCLIGVIMDVFLVRIRGYDENTICGIFSTIEKAQSCQRNTKSFWSDSSIVIEQYELDNHGIGFEVG